MTSPVQDSTQTASPGTLGSDPWRRVVHESPPVSEAEIESLLDQLLAEFGSEQAAQQTSSKPRISESLLRELFEQLAARYRTAPGPHEAREETPLAPSKKRIEQLVDLYRQLGKASNVRHLLLRVLAAAGGASALQALMEAILADPPTDARQCDLALAPLFQHKALPAEVLFPRLLAALEHPALAVQVLDLANYLTRRGKVSPHPASARLPQLLTLYSGLVNRLQDMEHKPGEFAADAEQLRRIVGGCVELLVSLSDALALIGDQRAVGKLRQALELSHRRLRLEAAAALARLKDEEGVKVLARLAAEPSVRPRAIAYLKELGRLDDAPEEYRTEVAEAEGRFAAWLAEPTQLGLPPHAIALLDSRRLRWPGFDEPVDCYLFRYEYHFPKGQLRGVGIAGPVLHALPADLTHLPPEDIYAIYAGWHARHEEMSETPAEKFSDDHRQQAQAARQELEDIGYEDVEVLLLGRFFGDTAAVASAELAGQRGIVVSVGDDAQWFPDRPDQPKLGPDLVYALFKGRALLASFNRTPGDESPRPRPR